MPTGGDICDMCGKSLKKFTRVWWERHDKPELRPILGKVFVREGLVRQIVRTRGEPGNLRITYWTGQTGYQGDGHFCSQGCGYAWAMAEIRERTR